MATTAITEPGQDTAPAPGDEAAAHDVGGRGGPRTLGGYLATPLFVAGVLAILYVYVSNQELGSTAARILTADRLVEETLRHIQLTAYSTAGVLVIAIPLGILLTRRFARPILAPTLAVFNTGQAVPSIGVLALFAAMFGFIGFGAAVIALVAYAALSVLRNTMVGIRSVDPAVLESGRGMGMSRLQVLRRIELPLAVPVILAGVRTALVINVGSAALATFIAAGGLGDIINGGITSNRDIVTLTGAALTASLALLVDYLGGIVEDLLRPRGL